MFASPTEKLKKLALSCYIDEYGLKLKDLHLSVTVKEKENSFVIILQSDSQLDLKIIEKSLTEKLQDFSKKKSVMVAIIEQKKRPYKKLILVASGKGGVGKSTICANLAYATKEAGYKVGVVDADIYGPSLHHLLNVTQHKPQMENGLIIPPQSQDIKFMSMGFMVPEDNALIWRGAMLTKSLNNLINGTNWGELDYLFVDMPPGTGDIYLSLAKNFKIDGAIIVGTPQKLAVLDVKRSLDFFAKLSVKVLGVISNMSYLLQGKNKEYIFGNSLKELCDSNGLDILAEIALMPQISQLSDQGKLITKNNLPEAFKEIERVTESFKR